MSTITTHERWISNPLVKRAIETSPDIDPASVLTTLHEIMTELDERFPGVPYAEFLSDPAQRPDMRGMRATLRRMGANEADIALVCPSTKEPWVQARSDALRKGDPYDAEAVRL